MRKPAQLPTRVLTLRPDRPIPASKIQQRISLPYYHVLYFRNENRMVAGILRGMQTALQIRQGSVQNRGTMLRAIKAGSGLLLGLAVIWTRIGIVLGNGALVLGQNIHSETFPGMQVSVSPRAMIDTDQHQQWIKRHGSERVGGHPLHLALVVDSDDRNPGGKAAHGLTEFRLSNAHGKLESPLVMEFYASRPCNIL